MNAQLQTVPELQIEPSQPAIPRWSLALRIAFRFWMVYLGLYCLASEILPGLFTVAGGPTTALPDPATLWPLRDLLDRRPYFPRECALVFR
jgi:hypothetical protein